MAHAIKTVLTYNLDGATKDFNIPFEYLARKFVVVTLIGVDRKVLVLNQDYRFATRTTISTTLAWGVAQGYQQIEIRRYTSATERLVDFTDGSILRAYDLNVAQVQTLHVAEEARDLTADTIGVNNDGHLDARGRRIVNLALAVEDTDAITFGQVKTMNENAWQSRNEALQFRNEAEAFKNESGTNAANTAQWRNETEQFKNQAFGFRNEAEQFKNQAAASQNAAAGSAQSAANSQGAAANSEANALAQANRATTEADRAKTEADKLGNWNSFAGAVDRVVGPTVFWKGGHVWTGGPAYHLPNDESKRMRMGVWEAGDFIKGDIAIDQPTGVGFLEFAADKVSGRHQIALNQLVVANGVIESNADDKIAHAFADQYITKAPYFQHISVQSTSSYHPIIKQQTFQAGRWAGAWSVGTLLTGAAATFHIHVIDENRKEKLWNFTVDGDFMSPNDIHAARQLVSGSVRLHGGAVLNGDGNIFGSAYGNMQLADWIRANFVGFMYLGPSQWVQQPGGYFENMAPAGHVQTGITANNGSVQGIQIRPLWMGFHNGQNRIVTSQ